MKQQSKKPDPKEAGWNFNKGNSGVKQAALKAVGRNMARAQNQKGGGK